MSPQHSRGGTGYRVQSTGVVNHRRGGCAVVPVPGTGPGTVPGTVLKCAIDEALFVVCTRTGTRVPVPGTLYLNGAKHMDT